MHEAQIKETKEKNLSHLKVQQKLCSFLASSLLNEDSDVLFGFCKPLHQFCILFLGQLLLVNGILPASHSLGGLFNSLPDSDKDKLSKFNINEDNLKLIENLKYVFICF